MSIPKVQTDNRLINQLQQNILTPLEQLSRLPLSSGVILTSQVLASGANVINHTLGRNLQGWFPVRVRASATFYDTQDTNPIPDRTLNLTASAAVTVDLFVF